MFCEYFGKCGGCSYLNIDYKSQLLNKMNFVKQIFNKEVDSFFPSPKIYFYRNRMDYCVGPNYKVGLKERGKWWKYLDLKNCLLQSEEANIIRNIFRDFIKKNKLKPWDTKTHKGDIRYIVIREGKFTNERLVHIITSKNEKLKPYLQKFADMLIDENLATSVYWGIIEGITDISYSDYSIHLGGKKYLEEKIMEYKYSILPNSFFQPNSYTVEYIIRLLKENIPKKEEIIELYSGLGTLTIPLAKISKKVLSIEINKEATNLLQLNLEKNEISTKKVDIITGKAEEILKNIDTKILVVDPPRSGLHPRILKTIAKSKNIEYIFYISCNPKTQKRDLTILKKKYHKEINICSIHFIDQFPHTPHIELFTIIRVK